MIQTERVLDTFYHHVHFHRHQEKLYHLNQHVAMRLLTDHKSFTLSNLPYRNTSADTCSGGVCSAFRIQLVTNEPVPPCLPSGAANAAYFQMLASLIFKHFFCQVLTFSISSRLLLPTGEEKLRHISHRNLHYLEPE